jgi:hypothetical protein
LAPPTPSAENVAKEQVLDELVLVTSLFRIFDIVKRCLAACLTRTPGRDSNAREFWFFDLTDQKLPHQSLMRRSFGPTTESLRTRARVGVAGIDNESDQVP